jgi:hypothetical protein
LPLEATEQDRVIIAEVKPLTMTSNQRIWSLLQAVKYLSAQNISGDFVECGVWRGGSIVAMIRQLQALGKANRKVWLYDTFEGMTEPTEFDVDSVDGISAKKLLESTQVKDGNNVWCVASLEDVERNVLATGYPSDLLKFVVGDVAQTIPDSHSDQIALLRLDTDWYESTKIELEILFPKLVPGGVCILDDYGHWKGARKAVDEYFAWNGVHPLMLPIDFSGRIFMKPI